MHLAGGFYKHNNLEVDYFLPIRLCHYFHVMQEININIYYDSTSFVHFPVYVFL